MTEQSCINYEKKHPQIQMLKMHGGWMIGYLTRTNGTLKEWDYCWRLKHKPAIEDRIKYVQMIKRAKKKGELK